MEATSQVWPYNLPLSESRRVPRLCKHAERAPLSIIGALFLGLAAPIVFAIFFLDQLRSYDRLVSQYPDLLDPAHHDQRIAKTFSDAREKMVAWARFYAVLLLVEVGWIAFYSFFVFFFTGV